jgi:hypothetical protein
MAPRRPKEGAVHRQQTPTGQGTASEPKDAIRIHNARIVERQGPATVGEGLLTIGSTKEGAGTVSNPAP